MTGKSSCLLRSLVLAFAALLGLVALAADEKTDTGMGDKAVCPVALKLTLKKAQVAQGVSLVAEVRNQGTQPLKLLVCPGEHYCCVRGLHPLVGKSSDSDLGWVGLDDPCSETHPKSREVVVPVKEAYSTTIEVPTSHLPADSRKTGDKVCFQVCFELADGKLALSDKVTATLE